MKIHDARLSAHALTLHKPLRTARGECRVREGWVLTLRAGDGCGQGEATPHPFCDREVFGRAFGELSSAAQALTGRPLPEDVAGVESLVQILAGTPPARHALESALLDLLAQAKGVPVAALLTQTPLRAVRVNALLVEDQPLALFDEARRAVAAGFGTLKVKVGLDADEARLSAVREGAGGVVALRIDANGAWTLAQAEGALGRLARFGLELCEQPVGREDTFALRALREAGICRIAADESLASAEDLRALLPPDGVPAADVLVLRPMVLGGVLPCLRAAQAAAGRGVGAYVASGLDGVVARAAAVQLAASLPLEPFAHGLGVASLFEGYDPALDPYAVRDGRLHLPPASGLGLEARS